MKKVNKMDKSNSQQDKTFLEADSLPTDTHHLRRDKKRSERKRTLKRLIALILTVSYAIGEYYINDYCSELGESFLLFFRITQKDVQLNYSLYSIPAIFVVIASGPIITKMGSAACCALSGLVVFISSFGFFIAVIHRNWILFQASEALYGAVGELYTVAQNVLFVELFQGNWQTMAFGISQSLNNISETISNYANAKIYKKTKRMRVIFFIGAITCAASAICSILWGILEKLGWKKDILADSRQEDEDEDGEAILNGMNFYSKLKIWWRDIKDPFVTSNVMLCTISQNIFYLLLSYQTECLVKRFGYDQKQANFFVSLSLFITIPASPIFSYLSVRWGGKNGYLLFASAACLAFFVIFIVLPEKPINNFLMYLATVLFSLFNSITAFLTYSCIGIVTPARSTSMVYGLTSFLLNLGLSLFPFMIGDFTEKDNADGYQKTNYVMLVLSVLGLILAVSVKWIDVKRGGILGLPENSEEALKMKEEIDFNDEFVLRLVAESKERRASKRVDTGQSNTNQDDFSGFEAAEVQKLDR